MERIWCQKLLGQTDCSTVAQVEAKLIKDQSATMKEACAGLAVAGSALAAARRIRADASTSHQISFDGCWMYNGRSKGEIKGSMWITPPGKTFSVEQVGPGKIRVSCGGEVCDGELQEDKRLAWSDGEVWIKAPTCRKGHKLQDLGPNPGIATVGAMAAFGMGAYFWGHVCDGCRRRGIQYRCQECDFDLCSDCYHNPL